MTGMTSGKGQVPREGPLRGNALFAGVIGVAGALVGILSVRPHTLLSFVSMFVVGIGLGWFLSAWGLDRAMGSAKLAILLQSSPVRLLATAILAVVGMYVLNRSGQVYARGSWVSAVPLALTAGLLLGLETALFLFTRRERRYRREEPHLAGRERPPSRDSLTLKWVPWVSGGVALAAALGGILLVLRHWVLGLALIAVSGGAIAAWMVFTFIRPSMPRRNGTDSVYLPPISGSVVNIVVLSSFGLFTLHEATQMYSLGKWAKAAIAAAPTGMSFGFAGIIISSLVLQAIREKGSEVR
jgi:hypothetical protein